jgi:hypothetical protein
MLGLEEALGRDGDGVGLGEVACGRSAARTAQPPMPMSTPTRSARPDTTRLLRDGINR